MALLVLLCLVLGLVCFLAAAFNLVVARVNLLALGLALWIFTVVLDRWPK